MHRGHIVVFYSRLILRIECSDGFFVIYGRSSLSHSNHRKYPQRKSREALHPHQNFLHGVLPSSASCRSTHVWISSRSPNSDRSFAACRSALASSRQPRLLKNAFQIAISSSLGRRPRSKHHSRISSSDPPLSVRFTIVLQFTPRNLVQRASNIV